MAKLKEVVEKTNVTEKCFRDKQRERERERERERGGRKGERLFVNTEQ